MKDIPFTSYDFWGYLTSGFVFLFVLDYVFDGHFLARTDWPLVASLVAIAAAYAVGHILAGMASWLWEDMLLRRWTGIPTNILMGATAGPWILRTFARHYYRPLDVELRNRIVAKAQADNVTPSGEPLFWAAFAITRDNEQAQARMAQFLNQYGLCRNLSFTGCVSAICRHHPSSCRPRRPVVGVARRVSRRRHVPALHEILPALCDRGADDLRACQVRSGATSDLQCRTRRMCAG